MAAWPLLFATAVADAPPKLGLCEACHGRDGRALTHDVPHLAGQNRAYLADALRQYRDGRRTAPVMNGIAQVLSVADIDALATWYAAQSWPAAEADAR